MDDLTRLLSALVAIPSVNPMGRSVSGPEFLEARMSDYLEAWFRELGRPLRAAADFSRPGQSPGLVRVAPVRKLVLFDVHQDTVPVDGMTIPPFRAANRSGSTVGRGSCDVKGAMAAMMSAFARLVREQPAGSSSVLLAFTVDEEFTHTGSSQLSRPTIRPTWRSSPSRRSSTWSTVTRGPCAGRSKPAESPVTARGPTSARMPFTGWPAYSTLSKICHDPVTIHARPQARARPACRSAGSKGDKASTWFPTLCEIEIDRRLIPGEDAADCLTGFGKYWIIVSTHRTGSIWPPLGPHAAAFAPCRMTGSNR